MFIDWSKKLPLTLLKGLLFLSSKEFQRYFDEDNISINEFYRFLAISFLCGPDRALRSVEKEDDLFENGLPQGDSDVMYQSMFQPSDPQVDALLTNLRNVFYGTFRTGTGDFDPRPSRQRTGEDPWKQLQDEVESRTQDLLASGIVNPSIEQIFERRRTSLASSTSTAAPASSVQPTATTQSFTGAASSPSPATVVTSTSAQTTPTLTPSAPTRANPPVITAAEVAAMI